MANKNKNAMQSGNMNDDGYKNFIPSALAVLESPPRRHYRVVSWMIMIFVVIVILWLSFAKVDIVVSARGKIVPSGKVKVVQSGSEGTVKKIFVRDGVIVKAGDPLIELDRTSSKVDRQRLMFNLNKAKQTVNRLRVELGLDSSEAYEKGEVTPTQTQLSLLSANRSASDLKQRQSKLELEQARAVYNSTIKELEKQNQKIEFLEKRLVNSKRQAKLGLIAGREVDANEFELQEAVKEAERITARKTEMRARRISAEENLKSIDTEHFSDLYQQLSEVEFEYKSLSEELVKANGLVNSQVLKSPVEGVVQQLDVNTIGGYVSKGQKLMVVVPAEINLQLDAQVLNRDIGFVDQDQEARVKIDAFEFTRYGYIQGQLQWVGNDAVVDEKLGEVYPARVALKGTSLPNLVNNRVAKVLPGMTASVDIVIGERNLIEYFIAPILRYKDESLKER